MTTIFRSSDVGPYSQVNDAEASLQTQHSGRCMTKWGAKTIPSTIVGLAITTLLFLVPGIALEGRCKIYPEECGEGLKNEGRFCLITGCVLGLLVYLAFVSDACYFQYIRGKTPRSRLNRQEDEQIFDV